MRVLPLSLGESTMARKGRSGERKGGDRGKYKRKRISIGNLRCLLPNVATARYRDTQTLNGYGLR